MSTRDLIEKSWRSARRMLGVPMTPASWAGLFLAQADGDARRAIAMLPKDGSQTWDLVAAHLGHVVEQERRQGPRLKETA